MPSLGPPDLVALEDLQTREQADDETLSAGSSALVASFTREASGSTTSAESDYEFNRPIYGRFRSPENRQHDRNCGAG